MLALFLILGVPGWPESKNTMICELGYYTIADRLSFSAQLPFSTWDRQSRQLNLGKWQKKEEPPNSGVFLVQGVYAIIQMNWAPANGEFLGMLLESWKSQAATRAWSFYWYLSLEVAQNYKWIQNIIDSYSPTPTTWAIWYICSWNNTILNFLQLNLWALFTFNV